MVMLGDGVGECGLSCEAIPPARPKGRATSLYTREARLGLWPTGHISKVEYIYAFFQCGQRPPEKEARETIHFRERKPAWPAPRLGPLV